MSEAVDGNIDREALNVGLPTVNAPISEMQRALARKAHFQPNTARFQRLYALVRNPKWLRLALEGILHNEGANTPGIDGITKENLESEAQRAALVNELADGLRDRTYQPSPVRRVYIPKANGKMRPLGIPTIADRTVQECLRMVLEPIYEGVFYPCSFGFRPGRSTMNAINQILSVTNNHVKCHWIVEGDIKGCFDNIPHKLLLTSIAERIDDDKLLELVRLMLAAGYVEEGKVYRPATGTPQGGVASPLLANIHLHQMDREWFRRYRMDPRLKHRAQHGLKTAHLVRYADDFILATNGNETFANALRLEFRDILAELGLELSLDKTRVTHVNDGLDFLGFHVHRRPKRDTPERYVIHVTPTERNVARFQATVLQVLNTWDEDVINKIRALNNVLRGWANYYRHVQSYDVRAELDSWTWYRFMDWLCHKHNISPIEARNRFEGRDHKGWLNWGLRGIYLYRMGRDLKFRPHPRRRWENPYINPKAPLQLRDEGPLPRRTWNGLSSQNRYAVTRIRLMELAGFKCQACGKGPLPIADLDLHHYREGQGPKRDRYVQVLCRDCHKQTSTYGRNRIKSCQKSVDEPYVSKGTRTDL